MRRFFISSTFKDMQAERDTIRDRVLPVVNEEAHRYGDQVDVCDLRWGIDTKDLEAFEKSAKVLDVCFREIDACDDPVIILMGDKFGSIPDKDVVSYAADRYGMQLDDLDMSITALEIEFATVLKKRRIICYYREITGDGVPEEYRSDTGRQNELLLKLKDRLKNYQNASIIPYTLRFKDGSPIEEDLNSFCDRVIQDMKSLLTPEWRKTDAMSPLEKEMRRHWTFIEEKSHLFMARGDDCWDCLVYVNRHEHQVILCKGRPGSGKSTLFSRVAYELREADTKVLPFIGSLTDKSDNTADILDNIIEYMTAEIVRAGGAFKRDSQIKGMDGLKEEFCRAADKYSETCGRLVIMIDALDQLYISEGGDKNSFIPEGLNTDITFFLTCTNEFTVRADEVYILDELTAEDKRLVVKGVCDNAYRELNQEVIDAILDKPESDNPLYISLLVQRLLMMDERDFTWISKDRSVRNITSRQIEIVNGCSEELDQLSADVLLEAGQRINPEMSKTVLYSIAESRFGLRIEDLSNVCGDSWNQLDFSRLTNYLQGFFQIRNDGRYDFNHKCIRSGFERHMNEGGLILPVNKALLAQLDSLEETDPVRTGEILYHAIRANDKEYFSDYLVKYALSKDKTVVNDIMIKGAMAVKAYSLKDRGSWVADYTEGLAYAKKYTGPLWFICKYLAESFRNTKGDMEIIVPVLKSAAHVLSAKREGMSDRNRILFAEKIYERLALCSHYLDNIYDVFEYAPARLSIKKDKLDWESNPQDRVRLYYEYYSVVVMLKSGSTDEQLKLALKIASEGLDMMDDESWELYYSGNTMIPLIDCMGEIYSRLGDTENCERMYDLGLEERRRFYDLNPTEYNRLQLSGAYYNVAMYNSWYNDKEHLEKSFRIIKNECEEYDKAGDIIAFYKGHEEFIGESGRNYQLAADVWTKLEKNYSHDEDLREKIIEWCYKSINLYSYSYHMSGIERDRYYLLDGLRTVEAAVKLKTGEELKRFKQQYEAWIRNARLWVYEKPDKENFEIYFGIINTVVVVLLESDLDGGVVDGYSFMDQYGIKAMKELPQAKANDIKVLYNMCRNALLNLAAARKGEMDGGFLQDFICYKILDYETAEKLRKGEISLDILRKGNNFNIVPYIKSKPYIVPKKDRIFDNSMLIKLRKQLDYNSLVKPERAAVAVDDALLSYAKGADRDKIVAIEEVVKKSIIHRRSKGVMLTKNEIYSSNFSNGNMIRYEDIVSVGLYGSEVKIETKKDGAVILDIGESSEKMVEVLRSIIS